MKWSGKLMRTERRTGSLARNKRDNGSSRNSVLQVTLAPDGSVVQLPVPMPSQVAPPSEEQAA